MSTCSSRGEDPPRIILFNSFSWTWESARPGKPVGEECPTVEELFHLGKCVSNNVFRATDVLDIHGQLRNERELVELHRRQLLTSLYKCIREWFMDGVNNAILCLLNVAEALHILWMARSSCWKAGQLLCLGDIFLETKASGCQLLFTSCSRHAPTDWLEASVNSPRVWSIVIVVTRK